MRYEIYSYGGGDFLRLIFNGIAQIFGDSNYLVALKTSALIGFMSILISAAFHRGKLDLQWLLGIVMIFMLLIVPKTHVIINDRLIPVNSAVVENIPIGISATASIFSQLSDWMTKSFETVFSLPNVVKYKGNGLLFAQALVEESTRFEITTPRLSTNFAEFWKSCVYYDLLLGLYNWDQVLKAPDLAEFFLQNTSQTRAFTYEQNARGKSEREIVICRTGFETLLNSDLEEEIKSSVNIQGHRLIPNASNKNEAIERFASAMPVAYQYLTGLSLSNTKIISQNILANSFKRGLMNFASDADASAAAEDFSLAKAEAERRTTFSVMGRLAKKMLPILHNIFEAFIYAIFPIVMLMAMLPSAVKILAKYALALCWINLWPPLYAILNFAISYHGQKAATSAMIQSGNGMATGLTIMTNTGLGNVLADYAAITGYLSLSIPMIAWMLISASGAMMAGLAGRMMDGYERPVSHAASEASAGNMQLGQLSFENQHAFQSNSSPQSSSGSMSIKGEDGTTSSVTSSGNFLSALSSSVPFSINMADTQAAAIKDNYAQSASNDSSTMREMTETNARTNDQKMATVNTINNVKGYTESFAESEKYFIGHSSEKSDGIIENFAKNEGMSKRGAYMAKQAIETAAGAGLNVAVANIGAKVNAGLSHSDEKVTSQNIERLQQVMSSDKYNKAIREEASTARDIAAKIDSSEAQSQSQALSSAISNQQQVSNRRSAAIRKMETATHLKENSSQLSAAINENGTDGFINWMTHEKDIPEREVRSLISHYNKGELGAKKSVHDLAKEYVGAKIHQFANEIPSTQSVEASGQKNLSAISTKQKPAQTPALNSPQNSLNWSERNKFEAVKTHFTNTQNNPQQLESQFPSHLKNENAGHDTDLKREYYEEKAKDEAGIMKNLTKSLQNKSAEFLNNISNK